MYHHGNDILSPWQPKNIYEGARTENGYFHVIFFAHRAQAAAHKINDIYFDDNTLR